jgi:hypothetical protein
MYMSHSVQQLFVQSSRSDLIENFLREYVECHGNAFVQCSSIRLKGVEEVLRALIRSKREFRLYTANDWTTIWEIVHHTDFADPAIARFLSEKLRLHSIWMKLDDDYNIWAYQEFIEGKVKAECFLPKSYFDGNPEEEDRNRYGSCFDRAEAFDSTRSLPLFLQSTVSIARQPKLEKQLRRFAFKLPPK